MEKITRREAIGLGAMAIAGLVVPQGIALASEPISQEDVRNAISPFGQLVTGNPTIDAINEKAARIWEKDVEQALAEGSEIITVVNPTPIDEIPLESSIATRAAKVAVTNEGNFSDGGPWINVNYKLAATYDVGSDNRVSNLRNHNAVLTYGLYNASIQILGYTYTLLDGGRTFSVRTTLSVSCYPAGVVRGATWQAASHFYYTGIGILY